MKSPTNFKLALASASPRRLGLLQQAGLEPHHIVPTNIDETPRRGEAPRKLAMRLSENKAAAALGKLKEQNKQADSFIVAADTVVAVGRRILPKPDLIDDAQYCLRLLSGRVHRVYSAVTIVTPKQAFRSRLVESRIRFKRLSADDIDQYIASGEWKEKAGGYAIQGIAGSFVVRLIGSYSSVVGLPLYETASLLGGEGYPLRSGWLSAAA